MQQHDIHTLARSIKITGQAFINDEYVNALSKQTFSVFNPATDDHLADVARCDHQDIDLAVGAARAAFNRGTWSKADPEFRKSVLLKLADLVRQHADELAVLECLNTGKTISDCIHEIGTDVPNFLQWYAELADKYFGKVPQTGHSSIALITREPVGVAGLVVPWNFPLLMATWKLAPALAVGCSVVVKPAEETPLTALKFADLAMQAGLPAGVLNVVPGFGHEAGEALGRHPDVDVISFTGSTEVGRLFMKYSGESNLKGIALEMGGKSPFIVLDDACINDDLIEHAATAAFWNAGQNCSANMRQIIAKPLVPAFSQAILERVAKYTVGDPLSLETDIGCMISDTHHARVSKYIESGKAEGATLLTSLLEPASGNFINPTIFADVTKEMIIAKDEIFGPVLGIMSVDNLDSAIALARDTDYGLHATLFTQDIDRALHVARELPCGTISINGFTEGDIKTPFGGYKQSGSLARDNGTEAIEQYLQTKTIWICTKSGGS
jgi:aldehyde dehydrogenase (NAD+)/gamma-glutamyl-gamma-aminobutyraldehyde dehydrogenase